MIKYPRAARGFSREAQARPARIVHFIKLKSRLGVWLQVEMYNPRWFKEEHREVLNRAIETIAFGTLVTSGRKGLMASHIPMLLEKSPGEPDNIVGHIARGNLQWRDTEKGSRGLAIFVGPEAYISPSWYQSGKVGGKSVPTWNYISVHARGVVTFFHERKRLLSIVTRLTELHEKLSSTDWSVEYPPKEYLETELKAIVGFEMPIETIEGKWKMGQNRTGVDRKGAIDGLRRRGHRRDSEVSDEMESALRKDRESSAA